MKRLLTAGIASLVLVASQAAATAPSMSPLGVADRAGSPAATSNQMEGEWMGLSPLVWGLIVAGIIVIVVVATDDDNSSSP